MARKPFRGKKNIKQQSETLSRIIQMTDFAHDGRAIGHADGRPWFVEGAIVGETVEAFSTKQFANRVEAYAHRIEKQSNQRQQPVCDHFSQCGGCSLQYLPVEIQREQKNTILKRELSRQIDCKNVEWLEPLFGNELAYRSRARMSIRQGKVGFTGKASHRHVEVNYCPVMREELNKFLDGMPVLPLNKAEMEIQVSNVGDMGLHLICSVQPTSAQLNQLEVLFKDRVQGFWVTGPDRVRHTLIDGELFNNIQSFAADIKVFTYPWQFSQVNQGINSHMIQLATEWLNLSDESRVLDLFSGSGNFSLPIARQAAQVVAVESNSEAVTQGKLSAEANALSNVEFVKLDLFEAGWSQKWGKKSFDRILLDPPRAGAAEVCKELGKFNVSQLVYVSCNPATLARDSKLLIANGYKLVKARIMDMFPHTGHVETITLFQKGK